MIDNKIGREDVEQPLADDELREELELELEEFAEEASLMEDEFEDGDERVFPLPPYEDSYSE